VHDSGAFGVTLVAVRVIGNGRRISTIERGGTRGRTKTGNLIFVKATDPAPEWEEDFTND
jgi:hypothetical protein